MSENTKIYTFTDLMAWKESHKLVLEVYAAVDKFPKKETYILTSQLLRAVISVSSNISEGFSRRTRKEKIQFYSTALGSLTEVQNQLIISKDLHYLAQDFFDEMYNRSIVVHKLVNGLIRTAKLHNT
jgi:four helix bundle protein